ncbi:MAG: serpin family protein [Thermodesulfobacteriota bacterium]
MIKKICLLVVLALLLAVILSSCRVEVEDPEFELCLKSEPEEAGTITVSSDSLSNEITLEAIPNEGYAFDAWLENGETVNSEPAYRFAHTEDRKLTAVFVETGINKHEIKLKINDEKMGEVLGTGTYQAGERVNLTASPAEGYSFRYWLENGMMTGHTGEKYEVVVKENLELTAVFGVSRIMPDNFAFKIYNRLSAADENTFISPLSIYLALALVYNSAEGETREEIGELLQTEELDLDQFNKRCQAFRDSLESKRAGIEVALADSIWLDKGFPIDDHFLETINRYHGAEAREIDFADPGSSSIINSWISDHTEGMLEGLIPENQPVPAEYFILLNAIYFMGNWTEEFDPANTEPWSFTLPDGSATEVSMMLRESKEMGEYKYLDGEGFEAVRIPYGEKENPFEDTRTAMYIFVPDTDLDDFYNSLNVENWESWMTEFFYLDGKVGMPRFEMEYEKDLTAILKDLGMEKAFDSRADFSAMSSLGNQIFLDQIKHKAVIEVNEKGTEAAAITGAFGLGEPPEPFEVIADRPFFFVIRDDHAECILFIGAFTDPRQ